MTMRSTVFAALAAVLLGLGGAMLWRGHDIRSHHPQNVAIVDSDRTANLVSQVSAGLTKIFSYDYRNPAATDTAAKQVLTGDAQRQYASLFDVLRKSAPGQQLTMTARVVDVGVKSLRGDDAALLVFVDQTSTRASDKQSSTSGAMVGITAKRNGSAWQVSGIEAY